MMTDSYEKIPMDGLDVYRVSEEEEFGDETAMRHHLVRHFNEPNNVLMPGTQAPLYANTGAELLALEKMNGIEKLKKRQMRKSSYKQFQINVFNVLERPANSVALLYHGFVFVLILASLFMSVLVTIPKYKDDQIIHMGVYYLEISLVIVFSFEYVLRLWSCSCHGNYTGFWGKARFIKKPYMVIDIIVVVATTVVVATSQKGEANLLSVSMFRFLRFLQVLRILRLDRQRGAFKIVSHVVYEHRQELLTCWYMSFILLVACSFLVYLAEKGDDASTDESNDSEVQNLGDGLYWGIITLSTVGYGDFSPQNWVAKLITCIFAFIGTAFFALPAGILGSGFALQVAQNQKQKHFNRRRVPAALVIQYAWRTYASHPSRESDSTWIPHQIIFNAVKEKKFSVYPNNKQSPSASPTATRRSMGYLRKKLQASRLNSYIEGDTLTSRRSSIGATIPSALDLRDKCQSEGNLLLVSPNNVEDHQATIVSLPPTHMPHMALDQGGTEILDGRFYSSIQDLPMTPLMEKEKDCIRFIRKTKLYIYIRKFKEECRPYDVKDVIEQYTEGQMEMFSFIKRFQFRMEGVLGIRDGEDEINPDLSLYFRIDNVEKKVNMIDGKIDAILQLLKDRSLNRHHHRGDEQGSLSRFTNSTDILLSGTSDLALNVRHDGMDEVPTYLRKHGTTMESDELTRRLEKLKTESTATSLQDYRMRAESRFTVTPSFLSSNVNLRNENVRPDSIHLSSGSSAKTDIEVAQEAETGKTDEETSMDLKSLIEASNMSKIKKYQSEPSLSKNSPIENVHVYLVDDMATPAITTRNPRSNSVHFDESTLSENDRQQPSTNSDTQILPTNEDLRTELCNECFLSSNSSSGSSSGSNSAKSSPHPSRERISSVADVLSKPPTDLTTKQSPTEDRPRSMEIPTVRVINANLTDFSEPRGSSSEPVLNTETKNTC